MPKPNYRQQKQRREEAKKKRNEEKRLRKGRLPEAPEVMPPESQGGNGGLGSENSE